MKFLSSRTSRVLVPVSSQRDKPAGSLDTFFSSTAPSKGSSGKKSPLKTSHARVNESDDDDDGDDDDDIVVSSLSKYKSKQKEASRRDSRDSG